MQVVKKKKLAPTQKAYALPVIGWREWLALPDFGIDSIKAKIDTGARTSSLHAYDIKYYLRAGKRWVKFKVHPSQKDTTEEISCRAPVIDIRKVKSSTGTATVRPVISTIFSLNDYIWEAEVTLIDRSEMGFRMLLGRKALKGRFLVHPGRSFLITSKSPRGEQ